MALAFTNRASQFITTNATSYVSSTSFTPTAGNLMVLVGFWSSTDTAEVQATSVSGNGVTYSQHATTFFVSGVCSGAVWVGIVPASPTLGSVTISGFSTARTGINFQIWEISGADVSGTALAALASVITGGPATATSGSVTMTGPLNTGNLCCGFFDHTAAETLTAGAGNTLDATGSYASPNRGAGGVHNTGTTYANPSASWTTSAAWRGFGVEINAASSNQTVSPPAATASASAPIPTVAVQVAPAVSTASASSPASQPQLRVLPGAATASASAPIPTVSGGAANQTVSPPAATASASAPTPTLALGLAPPAATASASAPTPPAQLRVSPAAATAAASSPTPTPQLVVSPSSATASASAPAPTASSAPIVSPPVATSSASSPTPTIQLRLTPPAATASSSSPVPTIQLRVTPAAATSSASSPAASLQLRLTPGVATATAGALAPTVSTTGGGTGATPPITVRTFLAGSSGHTWARSALSATSATGSNMATALTGSSGATHATGTSGRTRT